MHICFHELLSVHVEFFFLRYAIENILWYDIGNRDVQFLRLVLPVYHVSRGSELCPYEMGLLDQDLIHRWSGHCCFFFEAIFLFFCC